MGRHRVIEREDVVAAALKVIKRQGAARMSLDAVAAEAGICKASVLYDFKTKDALTREIVKQRMEAEEERVDRARAKLEGAESAEIRARVAAAERSITDDDREVVIGLCAALFNDVELRETVRRYYRSRLDAVVTDAEHPRGALLAFLAVEGLMAMEHFDLHRFAPPERARIIADILWLIDQQPQGAAES
ncbi:MAG: TetR/AcrR family transcriptional regulator [Pararhizobium sp.]